MFSPIVGRLPRELPGELAGVGGGDCCVLVNTQGDMAITGLESEDRGGVPGSSLVGFSGGDRSSLLELPCEDRGSSPLPDRFSSGSLLSFTTSADRFRTRPAASKAVAARCMMLTLPDRLPRPFDPSFSFILPLGVEGCDRFESIGVLLPGESRGFVGDIALGGVSGR